MNNKTSEEIKDEIAEQLNRAVNSLNQARNLADDGDLNLQNIDFLIEQIKDLYEERDDYNAWQPSMICD